MTLHNEDRSLDLLDVLRNPKADVAAKEAAFALMMSLPSGWWGRRKLYDFAAACTFACARYMLSPHGISVDRIDFEGLADEGLMILYNKAAAIEGAPKSWLAGVLKNLVKYEIRRLWDELKTEGMPEDVLTPDVMSEEEKSSLAIDDRIVDAIRRLSPALRAVVELYYIHQVPRHELAAILNLSEETLRKRLVRARQILQVDLAPLRDEKSARRAVWRETTR
jgi:RNA polymerase sigma factor (sigma-70 family)